MSSNKTIILAYGTLRKGYSNSRLVDIPGKTKYLGRGKTVEKYTLKASGIPFVGKNPTHQVIVDAWEIDTENHLPSVDQLEGHPNWYKREEIKCVLDSGENIKGWLYFMESNSQIIESGDYTDYRKPIAH